MINQASGKVEITLLGAVDQGGVFGSDFVAADIFVDATQADADGTTETVVGSLPIIIREVEAFTFDDDYSAVEAVPFTSNVFSNDNNLEGPLNLITVTQNGVQKTVTPIAPAVFNTGKGILTVYSDGTIEFISDRNLDNTVLQEIDFSYGALDADKDYSSSDVTITITDGAGGVFPSGQIEITEASYGDATVQDKEFAIKAGSDDLDPASIRFSDTQLSLLSGLSYESSGVAITYELSADFKTLTAKAGANTVLELELTSVLNSDGSGDLVATVSMTQHLPIDHVSQGKAEDTAVFPLDALALDTDGTVSEATSTLLVLDGDNIQLTSVAASVDEDNIDAITPSYPSATENLTITIGSDQITSLVFADGVNQPKITSGGEELEYEVSTGSGITQLIAYTAANGVGDPHFTVQINGILDSEASNNLNYTFTLYKAVDQLDASGLPVSELDVNFLYVATDFDGDATQGNIQVSVGDDSSAHGVNSVIMTLTEAPKQTGNLLIPKSDTVDISITAGKDKLVAAEFDLEHGADVKNISNQTVTQNGVPLTWFQLNSFTWAAKNSSGQDVIVYQLPEVISIDPGTPAAVPLTVTVKQPFDQSLISDKVVVHVGIDFIDSDFTKTSLASNVTILDGRDPVIFSSQAMSINEADTLTNTAIDSTTIFGVKGSDAITDVDITLNTALTTEGGAQTVSLAASADADGWYIAIDTAGDEVFRIKVSTLGEAEFQLSKAIDHANLGIDEKTIEFNIIASDFEGDVSNTHLFQVKVTDDVPLEQDKRTTVTEGSVRTFDVLTSSEQEGADTAVVTSITYNSTPTNVPVGGFAEINLLENGDIYGTLKIFSDGKTTVTTRETYNKSFQDTVTFTVTDKDGDTQDSQIIIDVKDEAANIDIQPLETLEDTDVTLVLTADPGDLDNGEVIEFISFDNAKLLGGQLFIDQGAGLVELAKNGDGNPFLSITQGTLTLTNPATGDVTPNGTLIFRPALNTSDPTHDVHFDTTVGVNTSTGPRETDADFDVSVTPVVDAAIWTNSVFNYSQDEDATAVNSQLNAQLFDTDGSEALSYRIENIDPDITLSYNNKTVSEGDVLNENQFSKLKYEAPEHFSGRLTFDAVAISKETSTGDTAEVLETITIDVAGVADTPSIQATNVYSLEDELVALSTFLGGELVDKDGSEELFFEFTLPDGWTIVDQHGQPLGGLQSQITHVVRVSDAEVKLGHAFLKPLEDMSSASPGGEIFKIPVRAVAVEATEEGISPSQEESYSAYRDVEITIVGVNDAPVFGAGPDNLWGYASVGAGSGDLTAEAAEDTLIPLNFYTGTADDDGSESYEFLIKNVPQGVELVDANGDAVHLKVAGEEGGQPIYSVTADELNHLYVMPYEDFSGEITFDLLQINTEPDGASTSYPQTVTINVLPVVEGNVNLYDVIRGAEDTEVLFNINPVYNDPDDPEIRLHDLGDIDGSEALTNIIVGSLPAGAAFLVDGAEIAFSGNLDLSIIAADFSYTFDQLIHGGHLTLRPPEDSGENFTIPVQFEMTDTSPTGDQDVQMKAGSIYADIWAIVDDNAEDGFTRIETPNTPVVSTDGKPVNLTGMATFIEEDIDGSEYIDYISITVPDVTGWFVTHPNGAIHDGKGNWLIKAGNLTSDSAVDRAEILQGATIVADHIVNPAEDILVQVRVVDQRNSGSDRDYDADMISAVISVKFEQAGDIGDTDPVTQLEQSFPIDGQEHQEADRDFGASIPPVDISEHINHNVVGDANDIVTFRIDAADRPQGGWFRGTGLIAEYESDGTTVKAWVFPKSALADLELVGQNEDFSGDMTIKVYKISTDPDGATEVSTENLVFDITPQVDDIDDDVFTLSMIEDIPAALTFDLNSLLNDRSTSANEGLETVLSVTFSGIPTGGSFTGPSGILLDNRDGTFTLNDPSRLSEVHFVPPLHSDGNVDGEFTVNMAVEIQDETTGSTAFSNIDVATKHTTLTFEVIADTDAAPVITTRQEGNEDELIAFSGMEVIDVDHDGSETLSLQFVGVPAGAILYYDNAGTLEQLSNDGSGGAGGFAWSLTKDQLDGVVMKPPQDFSGDINMTLRSISMETSTKEIVTLSSDFVVHVHPIADGAIFTQALEDASAQEGDVINIPVKVDQQEKVNANETITLTVQINTSNSDATAYEGVESIRLPDGSLVHFGPISHGILNAWAFVDSPTLSDFDLVMNDDAFGHLEVTVSVGSQDSALVGGVLETDYSAIPTQSTINVDISPLPDAPILIQQAQNIEAAVDTVPLGLSLELIDPQATGEVNEVYISGLPDTVDGIGGAVFDGSRWVAQAADVESLTLLGADPSASYSLTIEPRSTLNGVVDIGPQSTLIINMASTLSGDNTLTGDTGSDNLFIGGDGDDTMTGAAGVEDTYLYRSVDLGVPMAAAADTITNFDVSADHIDLSQITSLATGIELGTIINLTESGIINKTTTIELFDSVGGDVVQTIELTDVSKNDLYGGAGWSSDADILQHMLQDQTLITG